MDVEAPWRCNPRNSYQERQQQKGQQWAIGNPNCVAHVASCDAFSGLSWRYRANYRTTPASGLLALAYSFFGMRPARYARRPA
jgi:hypothetical protein